MINDKKILKASLKDKLLIGLDQLKLKIKRKNWTPQSDNADFCCIMCGKIHRNIMFFDSLHNPTMIKYKGDKTAKKVYTLDFCSPKCFNIYSQGEQIDLFDLDKLHHHLESGFWRNRWMNYYKWKRT